MQQLINLPSDARVFVDTNLLAYFYTRKDTLSQAVAFFLARGANNELEIVTSASVVEDVIHRVMVFEAVTRHGIDPAHAVSHLKKHPSLVKSLTEHQTIPAQLHNQFNINILPVTHNELHASKRFRTQYGLLTNDSIIVATMLRHKILHLATNDRDFERVTEIQVWAP
ncbi:MAG: PIN domain-containing protein [Chloroflexota bacterium]|nr:MAG: PIN domain-containing protein [Chloroflexota bacterium]